MTTPTPTLTTAELAAAARALDAVALALEALDVGHHRHASGHTVILERYALVEEGAIVVREPRRGSRPAGSGPGAGPRALRRGARVLYRGDDPAAAARALAWGRDGP